MPADQLHGSASTAACRLDKNCDTSHAEALLVPAWQQARLHSQHICALADLLESALGGGSKCLRNSQQAFVAHCCCV